VIHCHVDYLAFPFGRLVRTPVLHTLHGRLDLPHLTRVFRQFSDVPIVSISHAQRAPLRELKLAWAGTVYHGVPLDKFPYSPDGGKYLAFLGRVSPEKRVDLAIGVAKRTGMPLKIAAKIDPADRDYFAAEVRPLLDTALVEFIGEIGDEEKPRFLGDALALLFPIDWPEPFGLVMIESMACGTPVIARACGSVPEIIAPGRTGFVVGTPEDLVDAVKRVDTIERAACRRHVDERFTVQRMADDYEGIYRRLVRPDVTGVTTAGRDDGLLVGDRYYVLASSVAGDLPKLGPQARRRVARGRSVWRRPRPAGDGDRLLHRRHAVPTPPRRGGRRRHPR
jgi:glycosyltransferase involved in cell wall biosynthesis